MRELSGPIFFAVAVLMWTAGPGAIGPLRWPARVLPMLAIVLLVLICVLLSRYGMFTASRRRATAAVVLIGLLFVRSVSAAPELVLRHVAGALAVGALGAAAVWLARHRGAAAACALTVLAMFPIAYAQVAGAPTTPMSYGFPERRSAMRAAFPDFDGLTLQLADRAAVPPQERNLAGAYGSLVIGNYAKALGLDYVNAYTPIGHAAFAGMLCMAWDGSTCPDAFRRAFATETATGAPIVDLLKVDRVVLHRTQYPDARDRPAPAGWRWADHPGHERHIWVLERAAGPVSTRNGPIAHTTGVTAVTTNSLDDITVRSMVSAPSGGRIVFSRLAWPGHRVTLNGRELKTSAIGGVFLAVDIPAGTDDAELVVDWRPPGSEIGIATTAAGLTGIGLLQWAYHRARRRTIDEPVETSPAPVAPAALVTVDA
ncbi:hypothetical protein ACRS6B_24005 [Nocardia asteroides]